MKWKRCHGGPTPKPAVAPPWRQPPSVDGMSAFLETVARPHLLTIRRASLRVWAETFYAWAESEETLGGFDTERLERLVTRAWEACVLALKPWGTRLSLQAVRSLPPELLVAAGQLYDDDRLRKLGALTRITTAAAIAAGPGPGNAGVDENGTWLSVSPEQLAAIGNRAPEILGRAIGAANLVDAAQSWYRLAGKGHRLRRPAASEVAGFGSIDTWNGEGIMLLNAASFDPDPKIAEAIDIYVGRMERSHRSYVLSGLLPRMETTTSAPAGPRMWEIVPRNPLDRSAWPQIHLPQVNRILSPPTWYPLPDYDLTASIDELRPFDDALASRLGLSCDELLVGLKALGLLVERQTQCGFLRLVENSDGGRLTLDTPSSGEALERAIGHLLSLLLRGMLRAPFDGFRSALGGELDHLGWRNRDLATAFLRALTGTPDYRKLPKPMLFYAVDPSTHVLDLTLWPTFIDSCLTLVTSGDGDVPNVRARLFEQQVRERLTSGLDLAPEDVPWLPNTDVRDGGTNFGDVDFCFRHDGVLFNLDMKSWQRTSDYHIGHFHTIQNRLAQLDKQMRTLRRRGEALERKLAANGTTFRRRRDFLVVAFPEYVGPDHPDLWEVDQPLVITANELIDLVKKRPRDSKN